MHRALCHVKASDNSALHKLINICSLCLHEQEMSYATWSSMLLRWEEHTSRMPTAKTRDQLHETSVASISTHHKPELGTESLLTRSVAWGRGQCLPHEGKPGRARNVSRLAQLCPQDIQFKYSSAYDLVRLET